MRFLVAVLLGLLLLAPAARAASPTYKISAYGVQRTTTTSTATETGRCFDERGSQSTEVVVHFKTPRALRARVLTIGPTATLIPAERRDLKLAGTLERKVSGAMERASCADLNPDGSPKWVPKPLADSCSRTFDDYTASISFTGRGLEFNAQQPLLAPLDCVNEDITTVRKRVSARQLLESDGAPIRLQTSSSSTTAAPDGSSTSTTKRLTTVYVEIRRNG